MGKMISAVCIGTVLTQMILMGYFASRGTLNGGTVAQVVALMNGIDVSGDHLRTLFRENELREVPDYEEVLEARRETGLVMDSRYDSLRRHSNELREREENQKSTEIRFDERREEFNRYKNEQMSGENDAGTKEQARILQELEPATAKEQLLIDYDADRIDYVVNLVKAMSAEKQIEILSEFQDAQEQQKLHDILSRIGRPSLTQALEGSQ